MTGGGPGHSLAGKTSPTPHPTRRLALMPRRLDMWATPGRAGSSAARVLYQPRNRARVAALAVARLLPTPSRRSFPSPHTQVIVEQIAELTGVQATAAAALHVRGTERWVYALTSGDSGVVVKIGSAGDARMAQEASMLAALRARPTALQVPVLRWHGEDDGWVALVTDIVKRRNGSDDAGIEDARAAACALANMNGGFVVHGDLAPWNMIPSAAGLALVDWEKSRFAHDPLYDLAHYVVRAGALLHKWRPRAAVRHLVGPESVGSRYLREIGVDPESGAEHLRRYLGRPTSRSATNSNIRRYEIEMAEVLSSHPT
jgi:aminoglycoside phosphotransferase (APT) family kinase protein